MFDEGKSKSFQHLQVLCPDITLSKSSIGREISCSGVCNIDGKIITFFAESMPETFEETLLLGIKAFENLEEYVKKAKEQISQDFLASYKEDWCDEEAPVISKEEFKARLTLGSIGVHNGNVLGLDFHDDEMFGGHMLGADSLDKGETFTETDM